LFIYDDNFLSLDQILEVSQTVTKNNKNIIWHTLKNTSGILQYAKIKDNNITISEDEQHSHAGSFNKTRLSEIHNIGNDILQTFAKKHGIEIKETLRIKANILNKTNKQNHIHPPHVDMTIPHMVLLYYVNDSDGDTIIFHQKHSSDQDPVLTVNRSISPKAGSAILFDGLTYHSSASPQYTEERIVLNINFL
jgi:NAD+--asparagine ADP-ribosyltransferase